MSNWQNQWFRAGLVGFVGLTIVSLEAIASVQSASAQPAYGSYVGIGAGVGLSDGGPGEDSGVGAVITARYKFLEAPVSLRGQVFTLSGTTAFVPTVSLDFPIGWQTDAYVGVGASITDGVAASPVGNRSAFVLQPGIDYALPNSNLVIFANGVFAFNAYKGNGNTAISVQGGLGVQF